jgi:hypothetical protein
MMKKKHPAKGLGLLWDVEGQSLSLPSSLQLRGSTQERPWVELL